MKYNFDEMIDRKNTNCVKYDLMAEEGKPEGTIPLWVADMDFRTADCIVEKLRQIVDKGIFGYAIEGENYFKAIQNWYGNYFDWDIEKEWMVTVPGVVTAVAAAVKAFTRPGENVLIQEPVYFPFKRVIEGNGRKAVSNDLACVDGGYVMNLADLEEKIVKYRVKLMVLCSPHNPVGRVWTEEELKALAEICSKHQVFVISDEIHGDFVYPGHKHHVFATINEDMKNRCMICTAPSKTFNIAGLSTSNIFVPNEEAREALKAELESLEIGNMGIMGYAACEAAYTGGREWLEELLIYIRGNYEYIKEYIEVNIPQLTVTELQGTYLAWVDFSGLAMSEEELNDFLTNKAKVWMNEGTMFGEPGKGFMRVNLACPRSVLEKAMKQLEGALHGKI